MALAKLELGRRRPLAANGIASQQSLEQAVSSLQVAEANDSVNRAALELAVLRGPRPRAGTQGLAQALATFRATKDHLHSSDLRKLISAADLDAAEALVRQLAAALTPLEGINGLQSFSTIALRHADTLRALDERRKLAESADGGDGLIHH